MRSSTRIAVRLLVFVAIMTGATCVALAQLMGSWAKGPSMTCQCAPTDSHDAVDLSADVWMLPDLVPRLPLTSRITVLPVIFVPHDVVSPDPALTSSLLAQHLELARIRYRELLGATFEVEPGQPMMHYSEHDDAYFIDVVADTPNDRAHRILAELFARLGTDRYTTDHVLLVIYASTRGPIAGGGRTFNGPPGTGGGYVEMSLASLLVDEGYPFQSTLVHELGHAFGMTHVDCHGYDQQASDSIMSYNPAHHSSGLTRSATPGGLLSENVLVLAYNQRVFPGLTYDAVSFGNEVDLDRLQSCFLSPMETTVGALQDLPSVGFELYHDGRRVNGPDAALYSRAQAEETCRWNRESHPSIGVECRYNGRRM